MFGACGAFRAQVIHMNRTSCVAGVIGVLTLMFVALLAAACSATAPSPQQEDVSPTPTSESPPTATSPSMATDIPIPEPVPTATVVARPTGTLREAPDVVEVDIRLASDSGFFLELLKFVPDRLETRGIVWMQDFGPWWSALEGVGFDRPGPDAPFNWLIDMFDVESTPSLLQSIPWVRTPLICCPYMYLSSSQPHEYVGFDFRNADQTLMIEQDRTVYEVALGDYDTKVTAARLEACDECIEHELVDYGGTTYYAWGEDFQGGIRQRFSPPLFDHAGRGGRLKVGDGYVVRSLHDEGIEGMIDTINGSAQSLADSEDYQLAARALMGLDAYAGGIVSNGLSLDEFRGDCQCDYRGLSNNTQEFSVEDRIQVATSMPLLEPFTAAAAGYALDGPGGPAHSVLVLVHGDEESAVVNAERLAERLRIEYAGPPNAFPRANWGDEVGHMEIAVDGRVLLARLFRGVDESEVHISLPSMLWRGGVLMHD